MNEEDQPPTPAMPVPAMPPGTELVNIEIVDRRTGVPAVIQRLMLQPQRIILVKTLLDSLAGVKVPASGAAQFSEIMAQRLSGQIWVCEFGHQHHMNALRRYKGVDREQTLSECERDWRRSPSATDDYVGFYRAHMPLFYFTRRGWNTIDLRD